MSSCDGRFASLVVDEVRLRLVGFVLCSNLTLLYGLQEAYLTCKSPCLQWIFSETVEGRKLKGPSNPG